MSIYRAVLFLCALMLVPASALAQQKGPFVRDDLSGTLNDYSIHKSAGIADGVGARLRFDIDYEYKASLLMGEPVVTCSANISDPQGEISFRYDDGFYTVTIDKENAKLLTPYNVDFAITYRTIHADKAVFLARCNTGIPGSWTYDALNVPFSPDWDNFLCWAAGSGFQKPNPMPDSLPDDWCRAFGQGGGRTLDEDEAKKRFAVTPASDGGAITRAVEVEVAAFAINYNDLIVAEIKKISAKKIADRKFEQVRQVRNTLHHTQGAAAQAARQLDVAMRDVKVVDDPLEQARMLQSAMRAVLNIEPSQQDAQAFVELRTFILHLLSSDDERSFVSDIKQTLTDLQDATDQSAQAVEETFDMHRADAANAPQFAFAELEDEPAAQAATGPADITREIMRFEGHNETIRSVAFHPDNKRIVSSGGDKTIRVWDVSSGQQIRTIGPFDWSVRPIVISPDGRWIIGGHLDKRIWIWDIETGALARQLEGHVSDVDWVAISPDGRYLLSVGLSDGSLLWNFETGEVLDRLAGSKDRIRAGVFGLNSDIAILVGEKGIQWHYIGTDLISTNEASGLLGVAVDPFVSEDHINASNPRRANAMAPTRNHIDLFTSNGNGRFSLYSSPDAARYIAPSPDGRYIVADDGEGYVSIVDRQNDESRRLNGRHDESATGLRASDTDNTILRHVSAVAFSPDGSMVVSGGVDGVVRLWGP